MREDFDLLVMIEYSSVKLFSLAVGISAADRSNGIHPDPNPDRDTIGICDPDQPQLPRSACWPPNLDIPVIFQRNCLVRSPCNGHLAALRRARFPPDGLYSRWRDLPGTPVSNGAPDAAGSRYSVKRNGMISGCGRLSTPFLARSHLVAPCHKTR